MAGPRAGLDGLAEHLLVIQQPLDLAAVGHALPLESPLDGAVDEGGAHGRILRAGRY